jgi:hypothetical protein
MSEKLAVFELYTIEVKSEPVVVCAVKEGTFNGDEEAAKQAAVGILAEAWPMYSGGDPLRDKVSRSGRYCEIACRPPTRAERQIWEETVEITERPHVVLVDVRGSA